MRRVFRWILPVAAVMLTGCATTAPPVTPQDAGSDGREAPEAIRYPLVQPVLLMPGTIVSVREQLQFVVIDFGIHPLPARGTMLEVTRNGEVVGRLRVSGPESGSQTIADLVEGEATPGDEAHPAQAGG